MRRSKHLIRDKAPQAKPLTLISVASPLQKLIIGRVQVVRDCLDKLYDDDSSLMRRNPRRGPSERSIVFRFSYFLQSKFEPSHFLVDCDFNSRYEAVDVWGEVIQKEMLGKQIPGANGKTRKEIH